MSCCSYNGFNGTSKSIKPDDILDLVPKLLRVFSERPDVSVERLLEGEPEIRVESGQGGNFPGRSVVVVDNVLVTICRVERVILLRAKSEQGVPVVDVDPEGVDGGHHGVHADVEFVAVD